MALRFGITLAVVGTLIWVAIPIAPFVTATTAEAGVLATALWIAAEVLFWVGVAIAGKDAYATVKANPWRELPGALWTAFREGRVTA